MFRVESQCAAIETAEGVAAALSMCLKLDAAIIIDEVDGWCSCEYSGKVMWGCRRSDCMTMAPD